jgi:hypothetical protein
VRTYGKKNYPLFFISAVGMGCLFADQKDDSDVTIDPFTSQSPQISPPALAEGLCVVVGIQEDCIDFLSDLLLEAAEMYETLFEIVGEKALIGLDHLKTSS